MKRMSAMFALWFVLFIGIQSSIYAGELFQVSSFNAFAQGKYEGPITFTKLKKHGNLGMGTVNGLYGEMIALNGQFFQIRADGKVYSIDDSEKTPFAMVIEFKPDERRLVAKANDINELHKVLDGILPNPEGIYAFKIHGTFNNLKVRSVPRQERPYPILEEVIKNQTVFELTNVEGTLVGFRFPDYMKGVNAPGYHFHFITEDKTAGGHVLECGIQQAEAEMEVVSSLKLDLIQK